MKRKFREINWTYAIRNNPIQADPAPIAIDPNGSYSGRPLNPYEKPVQDADDL